MVALLVGGLDTGWTLYPPYSLEGSRGLGILVAIFRKRSSTSVDDINLLKG